MQVARCLEHGLLVAQDAAAAFRRFQHAASMDSAEAALRCGIQYFEGMAPGGALAIREVVTIACQPYTGCLLALCRALLKDELNMQSLPASQPAS